MQGSSHLDHLWKQIRQAGTGHALYSLEGNSKASLLPPAGVQVHEDYLSMRNILQTDRSSFSMAARDRST
jgi:hypothetical protein